MALHGQYIQEPFFILEHVIYTFLIPEAEEHVTTSVGRNKMGTRCHCYARSSSSVVVVVVVGIEYYYVDWLCMASTKHQKPTV